MWIDEVRDCYNTTKFSFLTILIPTKEFFSILISFFLYRRSAFSFFESVPPSTYCRICVIKCRRMRPHISVSSNSAWRMLISCSYWFIFYLEQTRDDYYTATAMRRRTCVYYLQSSTMLFLLCSATLIKSGK